VNNETERDKFEAWAVDTKQAYRQSGFVIFYNAPAASLAWAGWKARADAMAPAPTAPRKPNPDHIPPIPPGHMPRG
jgi:hypothetical protein